MDQSTANNAVKTAISFITSVGVSRIVRGIVANNVPIGGPIDKISVGVATIAIGGLTSLKLREYTDKTVDDAFETAEKIRTTIDDSTN